MSDCVFCAIIAGTEPATVLARWPDAIAIKPLHPVTPGHILIIPRYHTPDFAEAPWITAEAALRAAQWVRDKDIGDCNLITSKGAAATQTVMHLHVHVVPRRPGDGLALPWTNSDHLSAQVAQLSNDGDR